jgi:cytochrome P450
MSDWASDASLDIIGLAGMGHDFGSLADSSIEDTMKMYGGRVRQSRTARLLTTFQFFLPIWLVDILPFDRDKEVHAVSRTARNTSRKPIKQKQEQIASGKPLSPDIISTALESGTFTEEGLVDSMMTFPAAGHETSAAAFTWTVYLLRQHLEEQSRLRKEIRAGISSLTEAIGASQLDGLPYLHAICQESLRMYASIPFTVRDANKDASILGQFIPRGAVIIIGPWAINWSKDLWGPDAHTFNPERWMGPGRANSGGAISNYANLTFLHEPRSCIGQKFSVAELISLVATFVGRFEFELAYLYEKIDITDGIVAKPRNGMKLKIRAIEGW